MPSYWPRECRRTRPVTDEVASFFASFFSSDSWKVFFQFLCICGPWGPPKSFKIRQKQLKKHEMHKLGKRKASEVDFWRFLMILGVPRGGQKCTKMEKMPSKNRSKKRRQKRRRPPQLLVECGGLRAASRNARFLLRKAFARLMKTSLYTPALPAECGG